MNLHNLIIVIGNANLQIITTHKKTKKYQNNDSVRKFFPFSLYTLHVDRY